MILNEIIEYQMQQVFGLEYLRECLELRIQLYYIYFKGNTYAYSRHQ